MAIEELKNITKPDGLCYKLSTLVDEGGIEIRIKVKRQYDVLTQGGQKSRALGDRKYTVFAGHVHHYGKYLRNQRAYYTLGTTGGSKLEVRLRVRPRNLGYHDRPRTPDGKFVGRRYTTQKKIDSHQIFWRSLLFDEYYEKGTNLHGKTPRYPYATHSLLI